MTPPRRAPFDPHDLVFGCVPLRLACFINASLTALLSLIFFLFRQPSQIFWVGGGYSSDSRMLLSGTDFLGVIFGMLGVLGVMKCKSEPTQQFLWFQMVRWLALVGCCVVDFPLVQQCEMWVTDLHTMISRFGYSKGM